MSENARHAKGGGGAARETIPYARLGISVMINETWYYAKDLDLVVFNGHVHRTEIYDVDGVKYQILGGGGAEQDPILPGRTSIKVPANCPPDLYGRGNLPKRSTTTSS